MPLHVRDAGMNPFSATTHQPFSQLHCWSGGKETKVFQSADTSCMLQVWHGFRTSASSVSESRKKQICVQNSKIYLWKKQVEQLRSIVVDTLVIEWSGQFTYVLFVEQEKGRRVSTGETALVIERHVWLWVTNGDIEEQI